LVDDTAKVMNSQLDERNLSTINGRLVLRWLFFQCILVIQIYSWR